jgi:peroxiredoxin
VRISGCKVAPLNFWATWCHGCTLEIPWLLEFEKKYKDRGFTVIGVSMDADGWTAVKPFLQEKKVNCPVVIGNDDMARPYGLDAMPMTFLIDRDGKIAATSVGIVNKTACESQITELFSSTRR